MASTDDMKLKMKMWVTAAAIISNTDKEYMKAVLVNGQCKSLPEGMNYKYIVQYALDIN